MTNRSALGEFEHLTLLAIIRLDADAYGAAIIDELEARTGRDVSQAATYIALKRLQEKGLVTSDLGEANADRGGRPKRYFTVTEAGLARLRESGNALFNMWRGLGTLREGGS